MGISTLQRGLIDLGHDVEVFRPRRGTPSLSGRRRFNRALPQRIHSIEPADLIVGFDLDGIDWGSARPAGSRYVVALKGVAADEARFSRSPEEHRLLSSLARLEQRNARTADRVVVPSAYSAQVVRREYGIPEEALRVVPEPIDLALWSPSPNAPPPAVAKDGPGRRPTLLSVARQYPRKDTATLLRAMVLLRDEIPDAHLRIVGDGPELGNLASLAGELQLDGSVTFHGAIPDDADLRRCYAEADIFCLPSLQEGFGIVFLEAMAAALPIVAARAGAVPEVVPDGEVGWLVPPADPPALAAALLTLVRDPAMRRSMGASGLRRVQDFDLLPVASAFIEACLSSGAST